MRKIFGIIVALLAVLSASVMAANVIQSVYLNGHQISGNTIQVELGQSVTLDVAIYGTMDRDNLRVRAWLGGYESDVIEDSTEMFDAEQGIVEWKKLRLQMPDDMVSSKIYTLNLQIFDGQDSIDRKYTLYVEEKRHNVAVQDVLLMPGSSLEAGESLYAKVRLENMGEKKEEDIRVDLSIEQLGISTRVYLDELNKYMADENSGNAPSLVLTIPEDAATGDYAAKVTVSYNRGHSSTVKDVMIHVEGVTAGLKDSKSMVSVQSMKDMQLGQESVVKVLVANLGKKTMVYSLEANGLSWAGSSLNGVVSVAPGQTGELLVKVTPKEAGNHAFNVKVKEDSSLIKEASFNVEVAEAEGKSKLFWVIAGALVLIGLIALFASSMSGEKAHNHELH